MEIDVSKYSDEELVESWVSVNDVKFPDRAMKLYSALTNRGYGGYSEDSKNSMCAKVQNAAHALVATLVLPITINNIDNDLLRAKEQRVLTLFKALENES